MRNLFSSPELGDISRCWATERIAWRSCLRAARTLDVQSLGPIRRSPETPGEPGKSWILWRTWWGNLSVFSMELLFCLKKSMNNDRCVYSSKKYATVGFNFMKVPRAGSFGKIDRKARFSPPQCRCVRYLEVKSTWRSIWDYLMERCERVKCVKPQWIWKCSSVQFEFLHVFCRSDWDILASSPHFQGKRTLQARSSMIWSMSKRANTNLTLHM